MSKKNNSSPELWKQYIPDAETHITLPQREKKKLLGDFDAAIKALKEAQIPDEEIKDRLSSDRLGGFYAHPAIQWYPLDPGEKLYPLSMKQGEMPMFRLSVYFRQNVQPDLLQMALDFTIKRFPSFATTVKSGVFWHYLDSTKRRFVVEEEKGIPCTPMHVASSGSQVFRILYYKNRVSVEFFHVVTDGTGGMIFLKTLASEYLRLCTGVKATGDQVFDVEDAPDSSETANEFLHAKSYKGGSGFTGKPGVQLSGQLSRIKPSRILHLEMPADQLKARAKAHGGSVTAYMLAVMFMAHKFATEEHTGIVQIQVPVNMRKFHPSRTLRNFTMYCFAGLPMDEITTIEEMVPIIHQQLIERAAQEPMDKMMSTSVKMVQGLKPIPRFIKKPVAERLYGFLGDRLISNTLSNLGVVTMPEEHKDLIEKFDFVLGPSVINKAACAMVTYGGTAVFSITKSTVDPSFEERILKVLAEDGLPVSVKGSPLYER